MNGVDREGDESSPNALALRMLKSVDLVSVIGEFEGDADLLARIIPRIVYRNTPFSLCRDDTLCPSVEDKVMVVVKMQVFV